MDDKVCAALYARVSSQRQAGEATIQSQVAALRERLAADGLQVDDERCFWDEGFSGASLLRPSLERLRDLAWSGGLDRLYVHSPDRLARNYAHQMLLLEELTKHGVEVVFLNHDARNTSPEGTLLVQMQGMIAEYERAKILERTRRGRRYAARQGKVSVLGHAPYGYRYVTKHAGDGTARYDVLLEEARVVRDLFTWVGVEGLSLGEAARRLSEQGVPTRQGKPRWDRATLRGILLNPAYTGTARYGKTRLLPRKTGRRAKRGDPATPRQEKVAQATPLAEQEPIAVPALVSGELFAAAAQRLTENQRRYREQKQGAEFLLSGLLVCHRCGSAYCGRRQGGPRGAGPYVYYRCLGTDKYRHAGVAICANQALPGPARPGPGSARLVGRARVAARPRPAASRVRTPHGPPARRFARPRRAAKFRHTLEAPSGPVARRLRTRLARQIGIRTARAPREGAVDAGGRSVGATSTRRLPTPGTAAADRQLRSVHAATERRPGRRGLRHAAATAEAADQTHRSGRRRNPPCLPSTTPPFCDAPRKQRQPAG